MDTLYNLRRLPRDLDYDLPEEPHGMIHIGEVAHAAADEITWLRSALVSLLTLAEAENSPLTNKQVAAICKVALNKYEGN